MSRVTLQTGRQDTIRKGVLKRYPRLAFPVVIAVLISWCLFHFKLYHYAAAAKITQSNWLQTFASASGPPVGHPIGKALLQGLFFIFFRGENSSHWSDDSYDPVIWTMPYEFVASFVVFGLTLVVLLYKSPSKWKSIFPFSIVFILISYASPWYPPFLVGFALAFFLKDKLSIGLFWRAVFVLFGLYLLGDFAGTGAYAWLHKVPFQFVDAIGASFIICACYDIELGKVTSRISGFLGELSFPFYLLHCLVVFSLGCYTFLFLHSHHAQHIFFATLAVVLTVSIIASLPLMMLNKRWVRYLNKVIQ